jgi:type IV secretory pathway VirD2 relaxase
MKIYIWRFNFKQELVAKCGFWTTKKRYALSIINKEGVDIEELEERILAAGVRDMAGQLAEHFLGG